MSATFWKFQSGLPQKKICGFLAYHAKTAVVGWLAEFWICSSVPTIPSRMRIVRVQLRGHLLEADRRTASADLCVHTRIADGTRIGVLVRVDRAVGPDQLIQETVVGLGPPVGLNHHVVGAHAFQAAGGDCRGSASSRHGAWRGDQRGHGRDRGLGSGRWRSSRRR